MHTFPDQSMTSVEMVDGTKNVVSIWRTA